MEGSFRSGSGELVSRLPVYALVGANAVSLVGNAMTMVAVPWFVLQTTGSAAKTGVVVAVAALAAGVASLLGGPVVDRAGFKRTSVAADLLSGVAVAAVPLLYASGFLSYGALLVLVFLGAVLDAPGMSARHGMVPGLVRLSGVRAERVNSALAVSERIAHLAGPPLAGVLIVALGASNVLWLDAATFAVSAGAVAVAVPALRPVGRREDEETKTRGFRRYLAELSEGLRFLWEDRVARWMTSVSLVSNLFDSAFWLVVLPVYAAAIYSSAAGYGFMFGAFGGGALVGAMLYGALGHRLPRRMTLICARFVFGLPVAVLLALPSLPVAAFVLFVGGLGAGALNPLAQTVIQERAPEDLLGRVFGAYYALATAAAPVGMVVIGIALEASGLLPTLAGVVACYLAVAVLTPFVAAFREMDRTPSVRPERAETTGSR